jgi:uncharacterized protein YdaU (DUF1376 family)
LVWCAVESEVATVNFYKRHIGDYLKDTAHLTLLEHGVYTRLLDVYYTRESGIPEDQSARLIGARTKEELTALESVLQEFFELVDGTWIQMRCEREIDCTSTKAEANRENGRKGGRPKANTNPNENPTHNPDETQKEPTGFSVGSGSDTHDKTQTKGYPDSRLQTPDKNKRAARFDAQAHLESLGVEPRTARDWLTLRKSKKLTPTETALAGVKAEADKAGASMDDVVRMCCVRGWGGFKASWLEGSNELKANGNSILSEYDDLMRGSI